MSQAQRRRSLTWQRGLKDGKGSNLQRCSQRWSGGCPQPELGCVQSLSGLVEGDKLGLFCGMKVIRQVPQQRFGGIPVQGRSLHR